MTLTGDLSFKSSPSAVSCLFRNDFTIGVSLAFQQPLSVTLDGAVDVNGKTLSFVSTHTTVLNGPLTGTGTIKADGRGVSLIGGGPFTGNVEGSAYVAGVYPNAAFHSPWLTGIGTAGAINAEVLSPAGGSPKPTPILNDAW